MQSVASSVWYQIADEASRGLTVRIDDQLGLDLEQAHSDAEQIGNELGWTDVTMSSLINCEDHPRIMAVYRDSCPSIDDGGRAATNDYYTMEYVEDRQMIVIQRRALTDIIEAIHGDVERHMDQVIRRECEIH